MKKLEVNKWIVANNDYETQQKRGQDGDVNGNHANGHVKPTKAERTTNLSVGLARLAYRCHVRLPLLPISVLTTKGVQIIREGSKTYANDGAYTLYRTSETFRRLYGS